MTKSMNEKSPTLPATSVSKSKPIDLITTNSPSASRPTIASVVLPPVPVALVTTPNLPGPPQAAIDGNNDRKDVA